MYNTDVKSNYIYMYVTSKTQTINSWINWLYKKLDRFDMWKITSYKNHSISISSSDRAIWVKNDNDIYISYVVDHFRLAATDKKYW